MNRSSVKRISVFLVLILILSVFWGCSNSAVGPESEPTATPSEAVATPDSSGGSTTEATTIDPSLEEYKLGVVLPLSGANQLEGSMGKAAVQMAADEINAAGGINGHKVTVIVEDDQAKTAESVSAAEKMVTKDGVCILIGAIYSSITKALMPVAEQYQIPLITNISTTAELTEDATLPGHDRLFRVIPHDGLVNDAIVSFMMDDLGVKNVALLGVNNDWGRLSGAAIKETLEARGGKMVTEEYFNTGETNYLSQLTNIKEKNPDIVFLIAQAQDGSMIVNQLREIGWDKNVIGLGAFAADTFVSLASENANGVYSISQYVGSVDSQLNAQFVAAWTAANPDLPKPDKYAWGPYVSVQAACAALKIAGSADGAALAEALKQVSLEGATGQIAFDQNHQAHPDVYITVIEDGAVKILKTLKTQ